MNFGLDSPQINISKEPKGRFEVILHFFALVTKCPQHILNSVYNFFYITIYVERKKNQ